MRAIKFRAWDEDGYMFIPTKLEWSPQGLVAWEGTKFGILGSAVISLMQYTGVNDVNGKEIYSGDIVELPIESGFGSSIKERGQVIWPIGYSGFYIRNLKNDNQIVQVENIVKIIGNIYENGDLLK